MGWVRRVDLQAEQFFAGGLEDGGGLLLRQLPGFLELLQALAFFRQQQRRAVGGEISEGAGGEGGLPGGCCLGMGFLLLGEIGVELRLAALLGGELAGQVGDGVGAAGEGGCGIVADGFGI